MPHATCVTSPSCMNSMLLIAEPPRVDTAPYPAQETLFILERAPLFGTKAGGVYQVIDNGSSSSGSSPHLQNVITFPPEGAFIVDSSIQADGPQRTAFSFTSAKLKLPGGRALGLPPFGKGWFDNVYLDDTLRWVRMACTSPKEADCLECVPLCSFLSQHVLVQAGER